MKLNDKIRKMMFEHWNDILFDKYCCEYSNMKEKIKKEMVHFIRDVNQQHPNVVEEGKRNPQEYEYFCKEWISTILKMVERIVEPHIITDWLEGVHLNQNGVKTPSIWDFESEDRTFEEMKHNPNWKQLEKRLDEYFERNPQWSKKNLEDI